MGQRLSCYFEQSFCNIVGWQSMKQESKKGRRESGSEGRKASKQAKKRKKERKGSTEEKNNRSCILYVACKA